MANDLSKLVVGDTTYDIKDATAARRNIYYGTCTTAANTYKKVATVETFPLDSNNKPLVGTVVAIKYSNSNSYKTEGQTYQLNVNSTGDYPMYYNNAALATSTSANTLVAGYKNRHIFYMFDGSHWVWLTASYDSNTTYSGMTQAEVDAGTSTTNRLISPQRLRDNFYTEHEVDTLLGTKANSADLATVATSGSYNDLSDKPTIPSTSGLATETYVQNQISGLVNSAPAALDTLNELAAALDNDANFSTTVTTALGNKQDKPIELYEWLEDNFGDGSNFPISEDTARELTAQELAAIQDIPNHTWVAHGYPAILESSALGRGHYLWKFTVYSTNLRELVARTTGFHKTSDNKYWFNALDRQIINPDLATVATSGSYNDLTNKPTLLTTQKTILYASGTKQNLSFTNSSNASLVRDQVVDLFNNVGNDILLFLTNPIDSVTYPYIFTEKVSDTRWKLQLLSNTKYGHVTLDSGRGNNIVAWENVLNTIPTVDSSLTGSSQTNPVQGGAIYSALQGKEDRQRVIVDIQCDVNQPIGYSVGGNTITGADLYALCADPKKDVVLRIIGYDNNEDDDPDYSDDILYYRIQDSLSEYEEQFYASWWSGMFLLVGLCIESEGANIYFEAGIEEFNYVPTFRKINNKPLSTDITLTASDVGADVFVVNISATFNGGTSTYTSNKTFTEIHNAISAKKHVIAVLDDIIYYTLAYCENGATINFCNDTSVISIESDNSVHYYELNYQSALVSGTNIKTINNQSLLGSGNLTPAQLGVPSIANNLTTTTAGSALDATQGKALKDTMDTKEDKVTIVTVSTTGAVTQALDPNKFYNFTGSPTSLTLTLVSGTGLCIYAGKFTAGTGFTNLSFPASVKVADGAPSVEAGNTYEFSVMNNLLLLAKEGA